MNTLIHESNTNKKKIKIQWTENSLLKILNYYCYIIN